jgi:hypothetical protein
LQSNTSYFYDKTEFGFVMNTNTTADEGFKVARNVTGALYSQNRAQVVGTTNTGQTGQASFQNGRHIILCEQNHNRKGRNTSVNVEMEYSCNRNVKVSG